MVRSNNGIILAEISKTGWEHGSFNAAVVEQIQAESKLVYWLCCRDHLPTYENTAFRERLHVPVMRATSRLTATLKYMLEILVAMYVLALSALKQSRLCFLSVSPTTTIMLALVARVFKGSFSIIIHNELETLTKPARTGFWHRQGIIHRAMKLFESTDARVICLTAHGASFLQERYTSLRVVAARLPLTPVSCLSTDICQQNRTGMTFGIVGTLGDQNINTNIRELCRLLSQHAQSRSAQIRLQIIGGRNLESQTRARLAEAVGFEADFIQPESQETYLAHLAACTLVLFLCSPDMYSVSASSVLTDCISVGVPVLSLPCNYSNELHDTGAVSICSSLEEMCERLVTAPSQSAEVPARGKFLYNSNIGQVIFDE